MIIRIYCVDDYDTQSPDRQVSQFTHNILYNDAHSKQNVNWPKVVKFASPAPEINYFFIIANSILDPLWQDVALRVLRTLSPLLSFYNFDSTVYMYIL